MTARQLDFDTFARSHPQSHLIVCKLPGELPSSELHSLHYQLRRLIRSQGISADYATGIVRTADEVEIHCQFASVLDAASFGAAFNAHRVYCYPGVATSRRFFLDDIVREGLNAAVGSTRARASTV